MHHVLQTTRVPFPVSGHTLVSRTYTVLGVLTVYYSRRMRNQSLVFRRPYSSRNRLATSKTREGVPMWTNCLRETRPDLHWR